MASRSQLQREPDQANTTIRRNASAGIATINNVGGRIVGNIVENNGVTNDTGGTTSFGGATMINRCRCRQQFTGRGRHLTPDLRDRTGKVK